MATSTSNARLEAQTDLIRKPEFDTKLKGISDRVNLNKSIKLNFVGDLLKQDKITDQ